MNEELGRCVNSDWHVRGILRPDTVLEGREEKEMSKQHRIVKKRIRKKAADKRARINERAAKLARKPK